MKKWLQDNYKEVYATRNERKFAFTERFIRTLKNIIQKYMNAISKNLCIDKLGNIIEKYHRKNIKKISWNNQNEAC